MEWARAGLERTGLGWGNWGRAELALGPSWGWAELGLGRAGAGAELALGRQPQAGGCICANRCEAVSASAGTTVSNAAARLSSEVSSPRRNRP